MKSPRFILRMILGGAAVAVVAFLALRASPYISELPWIPEWEGEWADRNGNVRNLPAFAGLALVLLWPLGWRGAALLSAILAVLLECAQVFIAGRHFDWADIGWSLLGVALVAAPAAAAAASRR
jgi:hypothetical protein